MYFPLVDDQLLDTANSSVCGEEEGVERVIVFHLISLSNTES